MTQPPGQQPPQGGYGVPREPQTPPQAPRQEPPQAQQGPPPQAPQQAQPPAPQAPQSVPQQAPQTPPQAQQPPPQNPPPGYGYPQAAPAPAEPPGQPGYGYPQAPGQAPGPYNQAPGPYNQASGPYAQQPQTPPNQPPQPGPYQQPGPYNQQPGPYGQQPHAQQPNPYAGYPYPGPPVPPATGGGSGRKSKAGVIIAAAVAALLVIAGGVAVFALNGGDDSDSTPAATKSRDPRPTDDPVDRGDGTGGGREADDDLNAGREDGESKVLWLQTNDVDLPRDGAHLFGPWFVGDTVVKAMYKKVVAYSVTDGTEKWSFPTPEKICAGPKKTTADGKIVIGFMNGTGDRADCNQLQMLDLNTGKGGWKTEIAKRGVFDMLDSIDLTISGNTVAAGRTGHADAYRVSDGKHLFGQLPQSCQPYAFASGPDPKRSQLIAVENCPTADIDKGQKQVQALDPATGKAKWTYKLQTNWEADKIFSVDPLVVSLRNEKDNKKWGVVALNADGTVRSQLEGGKDSFTLGCGGLADVFNHDLENCTSVAADAKTLYLATASAEPGDESADGNEVIAFNLDTGKATWRSKAPDGLTMAPLRMDGGNVLVYMEASYNQGSEIATIAPTGGTPKVVQKHPDSTAGIESSFYSSTVAYTDGRFYLLASSVYGGKHDEELEAKTMMVFGD
ncbi:PQQ-binding-like beta-propeller repeat protein [Streptomyces sp. NPDC088725]|uniref:outer membrane protein assembly factor BamB family protein n=1 Tax=Streptomyces sp. NPDC088725 TaxID=3365873 RepID=UPI003822A6BD